MQNNSDVVKRALVQKTIIDNADKESDYSEADTEPKGQLAPLALSILMGLLYCARMARFDLLRITCRLATRVTKWTLDDDKRILRLMRYVHCTYELRLVGFVGNDVCDINLSVFTDADFAGDSISQRSTSGVHMALAARHQRAAPRHRPCHPAD